MLPGNEIVSLRNYFTALEKRGRLEFAAEGLDGVAQRSLDLRYARQGYELNVGWNERSPHDAIEAFHQLHKLSTDSPMRPVQWRLSTCGCA